jgi:succinate dehydrogenase/fumarate reductase flavoprotein subunit
MIDKILPNEEKRNKLEFEQKIESMRRKLSESQREDIARLEEKLKSIMWKDCRRREHELHM